LRKGFDDFAFGFRKDGRSNALRGEGAARTPFQKRIDDVGNAKVGEGNTFFQGPVLRKGTFI